MTVIDHETGEVLDHPVGRTPAAIATIVPTSSLVSSAAPVAEVLGVFNAYQELCQKLLDETDVQRIGRREFRKKSAWRKLAVAYGVSCQLVERIYERDGNGRIIRAEVVTRATAPNGRYMDGIGACDLFERCCLPGCKTRHDHCPAIDDRPCSGRQHFSNPSHDLPSTAHTRSTNRACADLFGMGEVSAEEIVNHVADGAQGGPVDETDWFVGNGWGSGGKAAHDEFRDDTLARVRGLSDVDKETFRAWCAEQNVSFKGALTLGQAQAARARVAQMGAVPPPGDPVAAAEAEVVSVDPEPVTDAPAATQDATPVDDVAFAAVVEQVKAMDKPAVIAALTGVSLSTAGNLDVLRRRLAEHMLTAEATTA